MASSSTGVTEGWDEGSDGRPKTGLTGEIIGLEDRDNVAIKSGSVELGRGAGVMERAVLFGLTELERNDL